MNKSTNRSVIYRLQPAIDALASLPSGVGSFIAFIVAVTGIQLLDAPQFEFIYAPLTNAFILSFFYFYFIYFARQFSSKSINNYYNNAAGSIGKAELISDTEKKRIAVHEAGHLLAISFLPDRPTMIEANVADNISNLPGRVTYKTKNNNVDAEYIWAHMLFKLSGYAAEVAIFDKVVAGCVNDNKRWETHARTYLENGLSSDYLWFHNPNNEHEATINAKSLSGMRSVQLAELEQFFSTNKELLGTVADRLLADGKVNTEDAIEILEQITPTTTY